MKSIKNIIFDLGAVIINIDVPLTFLKFAQISNKVPDEVRTIFQQNQLIERHEVGELTDEGFRNEIQKLLNIQATHSEIDAIWNALLLDIPKERIELIQQLAEKYNLYMLSNTNGIHFPIVENILLDATGINTFEKLFKKVYLSHEIQLRKPHLPIYEHVLSTSNLAAHETLFIDDNFDNIQGASKLGIQTIHLQHPYTIVDSLKAYV